MSRIVRFLIVTGFALLAAIQVIRSAVVESWAGREPSSAVAFWPDHPDVERSLAMAEVGAAAASLSEPPPSARGRLWRISAADPLAIEPFLVDAAIALRRGDNRRGERLLIEARSRDPRSSAARFLLVDLYLRSNRIELALPELQTFSRLVPGAAQQLAPALARYAQSAGAVPHLRRLFATDPELEGAVLGELAKDADNSSLVLALASRSSAPSSPAPWQQMLLGELVEKGAFDRAYEVWKSLAGVDSDSGRGLFNRRFQRSNIPAPFNWSFAEGSDGVAEPSGQGLHVLFFGRRDVILARQLMLLPPGTYQLGVLLAGQGGAAGISWSVSCAPGKQEILELPLARPRQNLVGVFRIPGAGCEAQWLELKGTADDIAHSVDFVISELALTRVRS